MAAFFLIAAVVVSLGLSALSALALWSLSQRIVQSPTALFVWALTALSWAATYGVYHATYGVAG